MVITKSEINRKEIYRYLGYRGQTPDEQVQGMVEQVLVEVLAAAKPKYCYQVFDCEVSNEQVLLTDKRNKGTLLLYSKNLSYNLRSCKEVYLMAATLGIGVDQLLQRYEVLNMAKASVSQACGAACIEALCDFVQGEILTIVKKEAYSLRPRFSPGYGDLSLTIQKDIFSWLDCAKRLGLTLTEHLLMYPTKSVSAFLGVTDEREECHVGKCKQCMNVECEFRDEG